jgi:hypothetical protein
MKTKLYVPLLTLFLFSSFTLLHAQQLKLGTNPSNIQKSALLELESKSQGLLLPRISDTTLATIKASPDGMIIFLTLNNSLCIRANGAWQKLIPEGQAITSMNGSTVPVQTLTATNNAAPASITTTAGNHFVNLPDASSVYSGFMGTGIQSFAGAKTFNGDVTANQDVYLTGIAVDNTKDSVLLINSGKVWKKQLNGLPPTGTAGGDLTGTYPNPIIAAGAVTGAKMAQAGATSGQTLKWNGTTWAPANDNGITSIGFNLGAPFIVTPATLTANGSFTVGMLNQTANTVFAAPDGAAGTATFRSLVAADIPSLPFSKITGIVPIAQGGTALTAVGANGTFLTSNGTSMAYRALAAADIPTLPFSKISGVVPIAQGGTGLTAVGAAGTVLTSNGTSLTYAAPSSTTLAGDVTGASGANTIAAKAVTYAKIQDVNTQKILGRYTTGTGSVQEVSLDNSLVLNTTGTLYADSTLSIWDASKLSGRSLSPTAPTAGQILKWNGATWAPAADDNTGSLSSIGLTLPPSLFTVTNSPLIANGVITAALASQTANTIFAAPNGANGTPAFRALAAGDIPSLPFSNITGIVPVAQGGTALTAVGANGTFLTSNGTSMAYRALAAADIPTLPFSKISGVVPIAQGGTGLTAVGAAGTVLTSNGTSLTYAAPSAATLGGDVTGASGANTIAAKAVTYAKIQDVNTQKLLGRYSTGTGTVQETSLDNSLKLTTAGTLYADSSLSIWNASKIQGLSVSAKAPATGEVLKWNGTKWETNTDNDGGATYGTLATDISTADVAGSTTRMKIWASDATGTVVNGVAGTTASSWNVLAFRGNNFTTQLYFDKNTLAVKEWIGNTGLTTNPINGWYKALVTNGNNNITPGSIIFGKVTSDASAEVGQDNNDLFWDDTNKELGIGTNTPSANLDVDGTAKIGTAGTVLNGIIRYTNVSMNVNNVSTTNAITVVLNAGTFSAVKQNATVIVNPRTSLPTGAAIAFARANANGQITVKFVNTTGNQSFNYSYDITVIQ